MFALASVAWLLVGVGGLPQEHVFSYSGPMTKLMADGATVAPVSGGLPFAITVSKDGSVPTQLKFEVGRSSWKAKAAVTFEGLTYTAGTLKGTVKVTNASGLVLEGLRLDIAGATEHYREKGADGKEVVKTRSQPVQVSSPLHFGDLQLGMTTDSLAFEVSGIKVNPETEKVDIAGGLTGLALVAVHNPVPGLTPISIDFDTAGKVYMVGSGLEALYRCDADGKNSSAVASLPQTGISVAVDRKANVVYVSVTNQHEFYKFAPSGSDAGKVVEIEGTAGFEGYTGKPRFGHDNRMYVNFAEGVARIAGATPEVIVTKVGAYEFESYLSFDVTPDGAMWVGTKSTIFRVDPDGRNGKRVINGPSTMPGKVNAILALRIDKSGMLYIAEDMGSENWPRVSVFDQQGRLVRMFGRGSQKARAEDEEFRTGEIVPGVVDFAFDSAGRLYLVHGHLDQSLLVFEPF